MHSKRNSHVLCRFHLWVSARPCGHKWQTVCTYVCRVHRVCLGCVMELIERTRTASISSLSAGRWRDWFGTGLCAATLQTEPWAAHSHTHLYCMQFLMNTKAVFMFPYFAWMVLNGLNLNFLFFYISVLNLIQITVRVPRCTCGSAFVCLCDIKESHSQSSIFIAKYYISKLNCWCHISW